ncbi:MAG: hypothetical protein JRJ51_20105 [Deltaproteobacteria bacterium]|nr:hypothetical protein [Deltaproteobacteria bacterium]MBW1945115.1 hypothetical protein [Deltaproteobacteria bacterium]
MIWIRIRNPLELKEVMVSEAYEAELKNRDDLEIIEPIRPMMFDEDGNLLPFIAIQFKKYPDSKTF